MQESMYDKLLLLPLFQGLGKEDFTNILEKVKLHFVRYKPGESLARQHSSCNSLIFIIQGKVSSVSADRKHNYILIETLQSPQVIEPYSLFGLHPQYTASYIAETEVSAVVIDKIYVLNELNNYEIFRINYLNLLSNRAQTVYQKLWNSHIGDTLEKIISFLQVRCSRPSGEKRLQIRMEDLASLINDTRINVSKALNELQERGLVILSRKIIHIPCLEKLLKYQLTSPRHQHPV